MDRIDSKWCTYITTAAWSIIVDALIQISVIIVFKQYAVVFFVNLLFGWLTTFVVHKNQCDPVKNDGFEEWF